MSAEQTRFDASLRYVFLPLLPRRNQFPLQAVSSKPLPTNTAAFGLPLLASWRPVMIPLTTVMVPFWTVPNPIVYVPSGAGAGLPERLAHSAGCASTPD